MKERPILFSGPMVRAILDGRKTQTRRVMKDAMERKLAVRTIPDVANAVFPDGSGNGWIAWYGQGPFTAEETARRYPGDQGFRCPFGRPGDRLWVRETWTVDDAAGRHSIPFYRADDARDLDGGPSHPKWRSPIRMPRWASRITLEIESVRVERLQDISKADVLAEGITERDGYPLVDVHAGWHEPYAELWDSINAKRGHSWESDPWVWVVQFRVLP